jgi:hypothetical protein
VPLIPIVGPSHAGKSTLTRLISTNTERFVLPPTVVNLNLDDELGSKHRSDGAMAFEIIARHSQRVELVLADCGAGLLVFSAYFRECISRNLLQVVAVWCDVETFRTRHLPDTVEREIDHNYGHAVAPIWERARSLDRLVDTSLGISEEKAADQMAAIVARTSNQQAWIVG